MLSARLDAEKITIKKEDDKLLVEGDLSILSLVNHKIIKNELEELASNILSRSLEDSSLKFFINKQAAYNNNFHMIDEDMSPLGDIEVTIYTEYPEDVIQWLIS